MEHDDIAQIKADIAEIKLMIQVIVEALQAQDDDVDDTPDPRPGFGPATPWEG